MKLVDRNDLPEDYKEMMLTESHHQHEIVMDGDVLRWKKDPNVEYFLLKISLNDLCLLLESLGYGKNSEVYRTLYRNMGYSLSGYYDVFYWEANNERCSEYQPPL